MSSSNKISANSPNYEKHCFLKLLRDIKSTPPNNNHVDLLLNKTHPHTYRQETKNNYKKPLSAPSKSINRKPSVRRKTILRRSASAEAKLPMQPNSNNDVVSLEVIGIPCSTSSNNSSRCSSSQIEPKISIPKISGKQRSRDILTQLQDQLKSVNMCNTQKINEMTNLVMELDNNLSFNEDSTISSTSLIKDPKNNLNTSKPIFNILSSIEVQNDLIDYNPNPIGEGTYSTVFKGRFFDNNVAVKLFKKAKNAEVRFEKEGKISLQLRHPRIVQLLGVIKEESEELYGLIFEYMDKGALETYLHSRQLDEKQLLSIANDVALALNYLHNLHIVHLDVKSSNILLDASHRAKVGDLGFAQRLIEEGNVEIDSHIRGTPAWMAPEVLVRNDPLPVTLFADVYSFGVLLWEMKSGKKPYKGLSLKEVYRYKSGGHRLEISAHWPLSYRNLITDCWNDFPKCRPSFKTILTKLQEMRFGEPSPEMKPRPLIMPMRQPILPRTLSEPGTCPPIPPPPPPPPPQPIIQKTCKLITAKPKLTSPSKTLIITDQDLVSRRQNLRRVSSDNSMSKLLDSDLTTVLKKVINARREVRESSSSSCAGSNWTDEDDDDD